MVIVWMWIICSNDLVLVGLHREYETCGNCSELLSCAKVNMIIGNNQEAKDRLIK